MSGQSVIDCDLIFGSFVLPGLTGLQEYKAWFRMLATCVLFLAMRLVGLSSWFWSCNFSKLLHLLNTSLHFGVCVKQEWPFERCQQTFQVELITQGGY
jgi:hypothetical protein